MTYSNLYMCQHQQQYFAQGHLDMQTLPHFDNTCSISYLEEKKYMTNFRFSGVKVF